MPPVRSLPGRDRDHREPTWRNPSCFIRRRGQDTISDSQARTYTVRVMRESFEPLVKTSICKHRHCNSRLHRQKQQESISFLKKVRVPTPTDLRQHRASGWYQTFRLDQFHLPWDSATFQFKKGTLRCWSAVNGIVTGASSSARTLQSEPVIPLDALNSTVDLAHRVQRDFTRCFRFTGEAHLKFLPGTSAQNGTCSEAASILNHWRERCATREQLFVLTQYPYRRNHG